MKKYIQLFLLLLGLTGILAVLFFFGFKSRQITMNPHGTVGNTAGNLNNCGLFCEYNDTVYFANPADGYSLYTMTPDEKNIKKITNSEVCNILAGGEYLYYFQRSSHDDSMGSVRLSHGLIRCDLNGANPLPMTTEAVVLCQMVDNYLYLLVSQNSSPLFYKMKIDKSDKVQLANYQINPVCAESGIIYFTDTANGNHLYSLNTATDVCTELLPGNFWFPMIDDHYLYYMDAEKNYRLCRYSFLDKTTEVVTEDRIECYNVGNGYIYYQCISPKGATLKMIPTDLTGQTILAMGNFTNINMTSEYVYFQEYGQTTSLFHSALGSDTYSAVKLEP